MLIEILAKLTDCRPVDGEKASSEGYTVHSERDDLDRLKTMLGTQGTLRPIFESRLKQKRSVREAAMVLRKKVAEAGVDYEQLNSVYLEHKGKENSKEESKASLTGKLPDCSGDDVDELIELMTAYFDNPPPPHPHQASPSHASRTDHQQQPHQSSYQSNQQHYYHGGRGRGRGRGRGGGGYDGGFRGRGGFRGGRGGRGGGFGGGGKPFRGGSAGGRRGGFRGGRGGRRGAPQHLQQNGQTE